MSDENDTPVEDDTYVIEDEGQSVEQIEHEMKLAAQEAASGGTAAADDEPAPASADVLKENRELKDRVVRTLADFENYRKRADREKQEYFKYALADTLRDLLPVLDNFDRALEHAEEGDEFHKGVLLIYKQLFDVLKKHGVRPIDEKLVKFDPNVHEAVVREENPDVPNHSVVDVLQKGYFLHDRLLRPALVKVAVGGAD